jgi:hypothetical protein
MLEPARKAEGSEQVAADRFDRSQSTPGAVFVQLTRLGYCEDVCVLQVRQSTLHAPQPHASEFDQKVDRE